MDFIQNMYDYVSLTRELKVKKKLCLSTGLLFTKYSIKSLSNMLAR